MSDAQIAALVRSAVAEAIVPLQAQLERQSALLQDLQPLLDTLGSRTLTLEDVRRLNGDRPSTQTLRRRIHDGELKAISGSGVPADPFRVTFAEFRRAQNAGIL